MLGQVSGAKERQGGTRGLWVLILFYFLIWVEVAWVC